MTVSAKSSKQCCCSLSRPLLEGMGLRHPRSFEDVPHLLNKLLRPKILGQLLGGLGPGSSSLSMCSRHRCCRHRRRLCR